MKRCAVVFGVMVACGDNRVAPDGLVVPDPVGALFGEPCTQPPSPEVGICHDGEGACHDESDGAVCRPFCDAGGLTCDARSGDQQITDRGVCVCVPR